VSAGEAPNVTPPAIPRAGGCHELRCPFCERLHGADYGRPIRRLDGVQDLPQIEAATVHDPAEQLFAFPRHHVSLNTSRRLSELGTRRIRPSTSSRSPSLVSEEALVPSLRAS
jgi:hypothetical protein